MKITTTHSPWMNSLMLYLNIYSITSPYNPCFRLSVSKRVMLLHLPYQPHHLGLKAKVVCPAVNFTLHCSDKSSTPPKIFKHHFYELCHEFKNYYRIFTDGSKEGNRVAAAVVH